MVDKFLVGRKLAQIDTALFSAFAEAASRGRRQERGDFLPN